MSTIDDNRFRSMSDLVAAVSKAEQGLRNGSLATDGLDRACNDARELYERLVVIRHKAREQAKAPTPAEAKSAPVVEVKTAPPPTPKPAPAAKVDAPAPVEATAHPPMAAIRLDTKPQEVRSTSPTGAAVEKPKEDEPVMRTAAEFLKAAEAAKAPPETPKHTTTLAEKMEKAHVDDLGKVISLSHKFWFTAELFNGDRTAFDKAIDRLNQAADMDDASSWMDAEVYPLLKKPADAEARAAFLELLHRRFA